MVRFSIGQLEGFFHHSKLCVWSIFSRLHIDRCCGYERGISLSYKVGKHTSITFFDLQWYSVCADHKNTFYALNVSLLLQKRTLIHISLCSYSYLSKIFFTKFLTRIWMFLIILLTHVSFSCILNELMRKLPEHFTSIIL